jgi:hypothetical protein
MKTKGMKENISKTKPKCTKKIYIRKKKSKFSVLFLSFILPIQLSIDVQKVRFDGATKNLNVISNINQELPRKTKQMKSRNIENILHTNPFDNIESRNNFSLPSVQYRCLFS